MVDYESVMRFPMRSLSLVYFTISAVMGPFSRGRCEPAPPNVPSPTTSSVASGLLIQEKTIEEVLFQLIVVEAARSQQRSKLFDPEPAADRHPGVMPEHPRGPQREEPGAQIVQRRAPGQ